MLTGPFDRRQAPHPKLGIEGSHFAVGLAYGSWLRLKPGFPMYQHILIATDGSRLAGKAVATGLALAAALKAKVTVVTAEEPFEALMVAEPSQRSPMAEFERVAAESARRILAKVSERAREHGVDCATAQVNDFPAPAILDTAKARGCDLIAMSSHGRRGLDRLFLGNQAPRVLAHSSVPVLTCQ